MAWLSKKEAGKYLGVCKSTIENLESRGLLKGHRLYLGRKRPIVRYQQSDLDDLFLRRQKGRPRQVVRSSPHEEVSSCGVNQIRSNELETPHPVT
jgi:excisionase family DNA binding protein